MPELTKSESNEDLGFEGDVSNHPYTKPELPKGPRLTRLRVNLSTPLIVKAKSGENMAGPGDVVGHFGRHDVMMSKDLYIALLGRAKYDDLVRKEMLKIRIAKRLDDGLAPFSNEQIAEQKEQIEKVMKDSAERAPEDPDLDDINVRIQIVDSGEGPPTAHPDEYATIVPGPMLPIPEDTEDEIEPPDPGEGGGTLDPATGANAGAPGTFTPEGGTAPADFAALGSLTANPTTPWAAGEYVVLGDASEAHWNGSAWAVDRAPGARATDTPPIDPFAHLR